MADAPVISGSRVAAGHDGEAELVVYVRFANGAMDSVTLDGASAERLLTLCEVDDVAGLVGQPWHHLTRVLG